MLIGFLLGHLTLYNRRLIQNDTGVKAQLSCYDTFMK